MDQQERIPSRLPAHAEHYRQIEADYDLAFNEVAQAVNPYAEMYQEAGIPVSLLAGSTLRFDAGPGTSSKIFVTLGVSPGEDKITSYFLECKSRDSDDVETSVLSSLVSVIKEYNLHEFKKYDGQKSIDNARTIVKILNNPDMSFMGFELRPLRRNPDGTIFFLGQTAVKS